MSSRWICALSIALTVGCGPGGPPAEARAPAEVPAAGAVMEPAPAVAEPSAGIALDGEGLRWVEVPSGSTRLLAFGAPAGVVEDALVRVWGPWRERTPVPDCGAEPPTQVAWANGVAVLLVDGAFAGWSASRPRPAPEPSSLPAVQSMAGLGVGAERTDVEDAYSLEVRETSLGTEFAAGGISGVFEGSGPRAAVASLWAGRACIYR